MSVSAIRFEPVTFSAIPGWTDDDHSAALRAFVVSCRTWQPPGVPAAVLQRICGEAERSAATSDPRAPRRFFEAHFMPHAVRHPAGGMVTGYYEPLIGGSRTRTPRFSIPVYRRPPDLMNIVDEAQRASAGEGFSHLRKVGDRTEPYPTRRDIELGALAGKNLELLWLDDPVQAFFLHVQGSGRVRLPDGSLVRIGYDGKNGRPYTSIGRVLVDRGEMALADVTLQSLSAWLRADAKRGAALMQRNESYVFFKELPAGAEAPLGANGLPLTPGRSLAVDASVHALGTPVFVTADGLSVARGETAYRRLMVAQDVGSAIKGPERGDVFFGSGADAERLAGTTKHAARFIVLLPRVSEAQ